MNSPVAIGFAQPFKLKTLTVIRRTLERGEGGSAKQSDSRIPNFFYVSNNYLQVESHPIMIVPVYAATTTTVVAS
jgi:hypothetical protein